METPFKPGTQTALAQIDLIVTTAPQACEGELSAQATDAQPTAKRFRSTILSNGKMSGDKAHISDINATWPNFITICN